jgi:phosphoribosylformylglycinamidine synthase
MIVLDGQSALSAFRLDRLNRQLAESASGTRVSSARFVYLLAAAQLPDDAASR